MLIKNYLESLDIVLKITEIITMMLGLRVFESFYLSMRSDHGFDATPKQLTSRNRLSNSLLPLLI